LVVLNCIVAESLDYIVTEVEKITGGDMKKREAAIQTILQGIANEHGSVVFGGNGYSEEWHKEAAKRGLPNLRNTVDALPEFVKKENVEVLSKYGVLSEREIHSRYEIALDRYILDINTEAALAIEIAKTKILPAALTYQKNLVDLATGLNSLGKTPETSLLDSVIKATSELTSAIATLEEAADHEPAGDSLAHAQYSRDKIVPGIAAVRVAVDELEELISDELWPLPTYQEMLFIK
jgi:glutamine synthetase